MILVTGATGFIGTHTVRALRAAGLPVRALVRSTSNTQEMHALGAELVSGDLSEPATLTAACRGVSQIVHLVGIIREIPSQVTFERVHTEGTRVLIEAARAAGVEQFVYISAIGARPEAPARYHQTKWAAEQLVRTSGIRRWTILRPSVVFGPGDEFINLLANDLVKTPPFIPLIGGGTSRLQPVWVKDLAEVIRRVLTSPVADGRTIEIGGSEQMTLKAILETIAGYLGVRKPEVSVPVALLKPAVALGAAIAPQLLPITPDQLTMLGEDNITNERFWEQDFSMQPVRLAEGIKEYLRV